MNRTYQVRYALAGHDKGTKLTDKDLPGINTAALVDGGFLKVVGVDPVPCPACVEQGNKRPPRFESVEKLREHYVEKHAGLEPPREEDLEDG